ncbi:MAG TPA: LLM class F420-dependent oxidoreductase [Nitrososphaeraceae archaeon]|nr:LLM class F420-dependent oxidoreductase [Nitrososphaeraceae archaeon]
MKIGLVLPQFGPDATKENIIKLAVDAEKEGFDSLWAGERLLWPLKPQTPYVATADGSFPTIYQNVFDPIETLTFVAAHTNKIALGTSVIDMLFHNPVILARRFATLDVLSKGRAICGLGIGWSKDEYQASNVPFKDRGKRADEFVQLIKKIWTEDVIEFKGHFYNIPASKIGPKPIQKPHIPIYLGGDVSKTFARIAKHADGWLALPGGLLDFLHNSIKSLRDQASKANRNPDEIKILTLTFPQVVISEEKKDNTNSKGGSQSQRFPLTGTIEEIGRDIQKIKEMGVDHIMFAFVGLGLDKVVDITKQLSKFAR